MDSMLIGVEDAAQFRERPRRKCPHLWRGVSLFPYKGPGRNKESKSAVPQKAWTSVYVKKNNVFYQTAPFDLEVIMAAFEDLKFDCMVKEAFILKMKASGKELDPRWFSEQERLEFDKSDEVEWRAWEDHNVIKRLSPAEARKIPKDRIFKVPSRVVRTNKTPLGQLGLKAKSRIVLPGHVDPDLGQVRTDAPTTQMTSVRFAMAICLLKKWQCKLFDVSTAFLSGKSISRDLYVRPPADLKGVHAGELWQILRSAYGLSEAPRLWYMKAKEDLRQCGFEELAFAPATFVHKTQRSGKPCITAILCLHVDDGFFVAEDGEVSETLQTAINQHFSIKEWTEVGEKATAFLGVKISRQKDCFENDMTEYVKAIQPAKVEGNTENALDAGQLKDFRRLVAQLRWPAHLVHPESLYSVSALAQRVGNAQVGDLRQANVVLKRMKTAAENGEMKIHIQPLASHPCLVSYFDASLGKSDNLAAQRGEAHFLTGRDAIEGSGRSSLVEFHSNKIARVVRSSMAAESCSMSTAADKLLYNMKLLDALYYAHVEVDLAWRDNLVTEGHLVTDARSLFDHIKGSSLLAAERQTSLDLLGIRQLVQEGKVQIHWTPTWKQFADSLTKDMEDSLFRKFRQSGRLNLRQSPDDVQEEERRAALRKAQRERRKVRMKSLKLSSKSHAPA